MHSPEAEHTRSTEAQIDAVVARAPGDCRLREERATDPYIVARRAMEICNACRYCEGFCAVFPAMTQRREFKNNDLNYLANLCHNCRACFYSCPYTPPHQFGINVPAVFSELRARSYESYCFPARLGKIFRSNGMAVACAMFLGLAIAFVLALMTLDAGALRQQVRAPGDFYAIVPYGFMLSVGLVSFCFAIAALTVGGIRFWRDIAEGRKFTLQFALQGVRDALSLKNLGATKNRGCNDRDERYSNVRRRFHHCMFYGFMLCFASTCVATVYDHFLGLRAPYPVASLPVQLGLWGGIGMLIGIPGLLWLKCSGDKALTSKVATGSDYALLFVLLAIALTGESLLGWRGSHYAAFLLIVHLALVFTFFVMIPYSKMVHGLYRLLALVHSAAERAGGSAASE